MSSSGGLVTPSESTASIGPAWRGEPIAAVFLAALLAGSVWWVLGTCRIPESSDQAIVGLMARHILDGKGHPVFYFGSTYNGSLEAHWVALVFRLLGASTATYRVAMAVLVFLFVGGVWGFTRTVFGPRPAFFATLYLVVPPFFFLYKGLTSDGAYIAVQLVSLAVLTATVRLDEAAIHSRRQTVPALALGIASGLGVWVNPVTFSVSIASALWLLMRRSLGVSSALAGAVGVVLGSFPWWYWNARHAWGSLLAPEMGVNAPSGVIANLGAFASASLPVLTGAARPLTLPGILPTYPGAWPVAGLLLLVALVPLFRTRDGYRGRVALLALTAVGVVLAGVASRRFLPTEPRLFVPLYAVLPPLFGLGVSDALGRRRHRAFVLPAMAALLLTNALSLGNGRIHATNDTHEQVTGPVDELLAVLKTNAVRRVYTSYWIAYRLAFESGGEVVASPLRGDDAVRIEEYERQVDDATEPAVVDLPPVSDCFRTYLEERGESFGAIRAGAFGIFTQLSPQTLSILRRARSLPLPSTGHVATLRVLRHPEALAPGGSGEVALEIRNESPCPWSPAVHLGHHWISAREPSAPVEEPERFFPGGWIEPGATVRAKFRIRAPREEGRWSVRYGLVQEGVAWFGEKGSSAPVAVVVGTVR